MREMKDSGIEWIGEIPTDWSVARLKYILSEPMKYGASESGIDYEETLPRYIRITDISADGNLKEEGKLSLSEQQAKGYILKDDTVLFARSGGTVGKSFIYHESYGRAAFAGYLISANVNEKVSSAKWLKYYTESQGYWEWVNIVFSQATIQNIGADKYSNMPLTIAPLHEQQHIIDYLDRKCSEIDDLVADIEKQIETLEQYKRSVITEAVTKGLKTDVEMKDSGIEWIGDVPFTWEVKPISAVFEEVVEKNQWGKVRTALKFTYGNIVRKENFDADDEYVANTILNYTVVEPGTIMINGLNLNFDFVSQRVGLVREKGVITSAYMAFRAKDATYMLPEYATYLLKSYDGCKALHNMGGGVRKILNFNEFKRYYVLIPSHDEQVSIVSFLNHKCAGIESIIAEKQKQLDTLAEYKKSLIYEYVTGKKEVEVDE